MAISRRRFIQAGAAAVSVTALGSNTTASASAEPDFTWLLPSESFNYLNAHHSAVCKSAFNNGTTWFSTNYIGSDSVPNPNLKNPIPSGYSGIAVVKFQSYDYTDENGVAWGLSQVIDKLPSWVDAVQYDAENWTGPLPLLTPYVEQGAWLYNSNVRRSYAKDFCDLAHSYNKKVVLTPSNDLCNNKPNPAYPKEAPQYPLKPGERLQEAYVRYDFASASQWLHPGDVYEYQSQKLETADDRAAKLPAPYLYQHITTEVAKQIQGSGVIFLAGIGTTAPWDKATCSQLHLAAKSVTSVAKGFWPNVGNFTKEITPMACLLTKLGY
jgi:hypothetical protein